jgi:hypothetical protein
LDIWFIFGNIFPNFDGVKDFYGMVTDWRQWRENFRDRERGCALGAVESGK